MDASLELIVSVYGGKRQADEAWKQLRQQAKDQDFEIRNSAPRYCEFAFRSGRVILPA